MLNDSIKPFREIPGPRGHWPGGNLAQIDFDLLHEYLRENADLYGPVFRLALGRRPVVVLSASETVQAVLKDRPHGYRRVSNLETVFTELGIRGVFIGEGDAWKLQRQLMNPAFRSGQLEYYFPIVREACERLERRLAGIAARGESADMQRVLQDFTVDITTRLAFGMDIHSQENPDSELQRTLSHVFPMISRRTKAPFAYWRYFKLPRDRRLDRGMKYLRELAGRFIADAEQRLSRVDSPENILQAMIQARNDDDQGFSQEELFGNVITLLLAGEETTANTLAWTLHYLAAHPHAARCVRTEISGRRRPGEPIEYKELENYPFAFACAREAMRIQPVVPVIYLENYQPQVLEGYRVPAGTMLMVLLNQQGRNPAIFPDPEAYRPQRWLDPDPQTWKRYARELMPFGGGPRLCPGMQLSFVEIRAALLSLLGNYEFTHAHSAAQVKSRFAFTVIPEGLTMRVRALTPE